MTIDVEELRREMLSDTPEHLHVGCHECGRAYDDAQIAICRNATCSAAAEQMDAEDDTLPCIECGEMTEITRHGDAVCVNPACFSYGT